tara:strand:+ start:124 stop:291 length:168 start_codon:yes stop_codon:yes gene_type:complete
MLTKAAQLKESNKMLEQVLDMARQSGGKDNKIDVSSEEWLTLAKAIEDHLLQSKE